MTTNPQAKRILCYGDSNIWGWVPSSMGLERYPVNQRWPGILQQKLGDGYEVIEEGLGGRTTMFDDPRPEFPCRNGLATLPIIMESHLPLDLVILMLGTTDTKEMMNLDVKTIIQGIRNLVIAIESFKTLKEASIPKILVIVPPIVKEDSDFASKLFKGATKKAHELAGLYADLADELEVEYVNPTNEVQVDQKEGIHIDADNHVKLAGIVYDKIIKVL